MSGKQRKRYRKGFAVLKGQIVGSVLLLGICLLGGLLFLSEIPVYAEDTETVAQEPAADADETASQNEAETPENSNSTDSLEEIREQTEQKILEEFDFSEMDESLHSLFPSGKVRFQDVMSAVMDGDLTAAIKLLWQFVKDQLGYEFRTNRKNLVYMLLIALIAAIFSNFSSALQNKQVSEISFYVLYILLVTMCLQSFQLAVDALEGNLESMLHFMKVLCPSYFLAVAIASGSSSSLMFYNLVLLLIFLVELVILKFLLPVIHIYIMVQAMNYMVGEDMLTEFGELIQKAISWTLRTLTGCIVGINLVQGLLSPAIDTVKRSTLTKTVEAIPGLGNTFGSVTDVVLGTAVLIKNSIGIAGMLILFFICAVPVIQMGLTVLLYKLAAALVQPVSDARITGCISSVSKGYELMLRVLVTVLVLFLLTIAIITASTS
jgi:stage III sporulation protein AE